MNNKNKKLLEKHLQEIYTNNLKCWARTSIKEGMLLKRKWDGRITEVESIHKTYGWIVGNDLNEDWSNIDDFEIAYKEMIARSL
jgi:hypothetical protein